MRPGTVLALAALALSVVALLVAAADEGAPPPLAEAAPRADVEAGARLDALAEEHRRLRERLDRLERELEGAGREPVVEDAVTAADLERLRAELLAAAPATPPVDEVARPEVFRDEVARALEDLERERSLEKARIQADRSVEQLDALLGKVRASLGLTANQTEELRAALTAKYERDEDLVRLWATGAGDEVLVERKQADHDAHREDLARILTADQLDRYLGLSSKH